MYMWHVVSLHKYLACLCSLTMEYVCEWLTDLITDNPITLCIGPNDCGQVMHTKLNSWSVRVPIIIVWI